MESEKKKPALMDCSLIQLPAYSLFLVNIRLMLIVQGVNKHVRNNCKCKFNSLFYSIHIILEPPQATEDCPHQYGYFRLGDATNCGQFKNCVEGRGYIFDCPEGLAFNGDSYRCDWPDQVLTCDAEGKFLKIVNTGK